MSIADELPYDEDNLLIDNESLATDIEIILDGDVRAVEALAGLFVSLKRGIDSGLQGIRQTSNTLLNAVELTYLRTAAHSAALKLYVLSQEGELKFQDEPVNLINAAIGRSTAGVRAGKTSGNRRSSKSPR